METIIFGLNQTQDGIKVTSDTIHSFYTHTHVYHEMLFYEPFDGFITVNDESIAVDSHTVLFLTPNDFHSTTCRVAGHARYTKIAFRTDMVDEHLEKALSFPIVLQSYLSNPLVTALTRKIAACPPLPRLRILLNALLLTLEEEGLCMNTAPSHGIKLLVLDAVRIINEQFYEHISLQSVAQQLHVTPQHLSTTFSRQMGISFSSYLRDKRLKYAAELLKNQPTTTTEICYRCGYENLSHFIRSFKRKYGISPGNYEKRHAMKNI